MGPGIHFYRIIIVLVPDAHFFMVTPVLTAIYSVPLILIGTALILFGKRERRIEEV